METGKGQGEKRRVAVGAGLLCKQRHWSGVHRAQQGCAHSHTIATTTKPQPHLNPLTEGSGLSAEVVAVVQQSLDGINGVRELSPHGPAVVCNTQCHCRKRVSQERWRGGEVERSREVERGRERGREREVEREVERERERSRERGRERKRLFTEGLAKNWDNGEHLPGRKLPSSRSRASVSMVTFLIFVSTSFSHLQEDARVHVSVCGEIQCKIAP